MKVEIAEFRKFVSTVDVDNSLAGEALVMAAYAKAPGWHEVPRDEPEVVITRKDTGEVLAHFDRRGHEVIHLSEGESKDLVEVLLNPPEPNEALRELMVEHKEAVG